MEAHPSQQTYIFPVMLLKFNISLVLRSTNFNWISNSNQSPPYSSPSVVPGENRLFAIGNELNRLTLSSSS
eukprot:30226-Amorphochlora_amoeboformis.AAC.1